MPKAEMSLVKRVNGNSEVKRSSFPFRRGRIDRVDLPSRLKAVRDGLRRVQR